MSLSPVPDYEPPSQGRVLPHDTLAEQSTLGAMLLSMDAVSLVFDLVKGADFYSPKHEVVFDAIFAVFNKGEPVDVITVTAELTKRGSLVKAGGADYLHTLTSIVPTAANADFYAKIVQEKATLRRLVEVGTRIAQLGYTSEGEIDELVNTAQSDVYAVLRSASANDYAPIDTAMAEAIEEINQAQQRGGELVGVPTGFTDLDALTHGLHPGQLVIIAARPAVGKSTFALDIARHAALRNKQPTVVFSLEMSRSEIAMRMLSAETNIFMQHMRKGDINNTDFARISRAQGDLAGSPLFIDDSPNLTLVEIRAKARRMVQDHGLKLIIIDYLQLMSSGKKVESRQQEVSEFSRALKLLAKELKIPVIAISQLNRNSEASKDKKPEISQLRESGSLEQDADVIILLHREALYEKEHPRAGEADVILAKQRNGPTDTVVVAFQGQYSRFANIQR